MPPECSKNTEFIRAELKLFRSRIEFHRKRMVRKKGREVAYAEAKKDYLEVWMPRNAERFRRFFCLRCADHNKCGCSAENNMHGRGAKS